MSSPRLAVGIALCALPVLAPAQTDWTQLTTATAPSPRVGHAMAYDLARDQVVLFGGQDSTGRLADTWTFDGTTWTPVPTTAAPLPRAAHAMAYDLGRDRVVMFGGIGIGTGVLGDTWEWDGSAWTQAVPATSPPARRSQPMVYHLARGTVVLWGGYSTQDLNDTWEWNGTTWTQIVTANSPAARRASDMAYEPTGAGLLLFSGYLQGSDTWFFDGVDWIQRQPATVPPARYDHMMVSDLARGRVVMTGGTAAADTWEWDGSDWVQRLPATQPPARYDGWLVYDQLRARCVLFSGNNNVADTWSYAPVAPASFRAFGSGCPGTNAQSPRLGSNALPWLGTTFEIVVDRMPAAGGLAIVVTGFTDQVWNGVPLPLDLAFLGMPGCPLLVEPAVPTVLLNAGGVARWSLALPNTPAFLGARFYSQAAVTDNGANAGGLTVSNAGESVVGGL